MKPRASVILAAYNCSPYIVQAIDSVLVQDYPSFEIVILNDGSTDDTGKILQTYRKHPLIRVIHQKHRGLSWARDRLLKASDGKYIALFDADDVMLPGRLKKQADILDKHSSFGACYGKGKVVDVHLKPKKDGLYGAEFGTSFEKTWDIIKTPMLPGTLMFRKRIAEKIGGFNKIFNYYSADTDFMYRLAENTRLFFLNECLILYRRRKGSISDNKVGEEEYIARRMAIQRRYGVDVEFLGNK